MELYFMFASKGFYISLSFQEEIFINLNLDP
jgi:hypothetical protein